MSVYALEDRHPVVPASCWIAPGACVVGEVELSADVSVWFGAVLRGDNSPIQIGRGTNIQEHAVLHSDIDLPVNVGNQVTIGHRAIIHACDIGDNSLIGMGAIILTGAKIGMNCIIGAGCLVGEGKSIPDGSLVVGVPGKVVRGLTIEEFELVHRSSERYVANGLKFKRGLARLED